MKHYVVIAGVLTIGAAQRVLLSKEQASTRAHKLKAVAEADEGTFEPSEPLQFIVGETLGIDKLQPVQEPFVDLTEEQKEADAAALRKKAAKKEAAERKKREAEDAEMAKVYAASSELQAQYATVEAYIEDRRKAPL